MDGHEGRPSGTVGRRMLGTAMLGVGIGRLLGIDGAYAQPGPVKGGMLLAGVPYDKDTLNPYATGFLGDIEATVFVECRQGYCTADRSSFDPLERSSSWPGWQLTPIWSIPVRRT